MTTATSAPYPARLEIDYPDRDLDRLSSALRIFWVIPIGIVLALVSGPYQGEASSQGSATAGGILFLATVLMLVFRQKYPKWWFDFHLELNRFSTRVYSYLALMNDQYPSTDEEQHVHLELDYPDAQNDLNRWLPLVKWFLAIPHYLVLIVLFIGSIFAIIGAWFAILFTGRYPRGIFDFIEGVMRWGLRVEAYAFLLITDRYPPFSLN